MSKNPTKTLLVIRVVSLYALSVVVFLLGIWSIDIVQRSKISHSPIINTVVYQKNTNPTFTAIEGEPVRFVVERLGISLPIIYGYYDNNSDTWSLSGGTVYFATITSRPNDQGGSTFMYGHNQDSTLAKLSDLTAGDSLQIETANNYIFSYRYSYDRRVSLSDTSVLFEKPVKPQLVVMMCEGWFNSIRRLMYFDFVSVK